MITTVKHLNTLIDFLAKRDINELSPKELFSKYQITTADVIILFGGSIPEGCKLLAKAYQNNLAKNYMIVGGIGHTTDSLRQKMQLVLQDYDTYTKSEAEMMNEYLKIKYHIDNCILETHSSNCGNNITYALATLKQLNINPKSIIFMQDATMQCRMNAGFNKYVSNNVTLINYATYKNYFTLKQNKLSLENDNLWGMWGIDRYITLLMGEIPRLLDDENGYGPCGKNFIAHVDIPQKVLSSYEYLKNTLNITTRQANPLFSSK